MEITAQIAALEEETKVLKGEIKSILEEIRGAVLAQDNPFGPRSGLQVFQPIERSSPGEERPSHEDEGTAALRTTPPALAQAHDAPPAVTPAEPASGTPGIWDVPQQVPLPAAAGMVPQATAPSAMATGNAGVAPVPQFPEAATSCPWSVSTIASLVAWVDETTTRLGSTHLHMILDLARFAGILPSEAEEALLKVIKLASGRKDNSTVSVNDTLVALRQLEVIFQEPEGDELTVLRRRRRAGRNP
jgi:hypothetical protein